jgi:hypothetical protein
MPVLEHSVSEFIEQFKTHASRVTVYPQTEASPLLEVRVGGKVVYVFDRVGPYATPTGDVWMIINPMVNTLVKTESREAELNLAGVSKLEGVGQVVAFAPSHVVVQAKAKLVLGVLDDSWRGFAVSDWVEFSSLEPVHGFFVRREK